MILKSIKFAAMKYADQEATGNRSMCISQKSMRIDTGPGVTEK